MTTTPRQTQKPTWAFLFGQPGADPLRDRTVLDHPTQRTVLVPLPDEDDAPSVAVGLLDGDDAVHLIELCGGFTTSQTARVIEAVDGRVPVGHVAYGLESVEGAAAYKARFD